MKAIVFNKFGGPEVLEYVDMPMPTPKEGQVLVKMFSAGVCKADWRVRTGRCQWLEEPFPVVLGYEMAGRIEALGPGVTDFSVGQPVHVLHMACFGTYSEYMAVTVDDVVAMPEGIDFDAAASAYNYYVAWGLLNSVVDSKSGESLYIGGAAGGVGTAVIQLALHKGMHIIASASNEEKCAYLRDLGLTDVFNYKKENAVEKIRSFTDGQGVNYVYDQVAGKDFCKQFDMLTVYGQIILYNFLGGYPKDEEIIHILQSRCEYCYGIRYFSIHVHDKDPAGFKKVKEQVLNLMATGKINPPIYKVMPLSEAGAAHELVDSGQVLGKLVLHP